MNIFVTVVLVLAASGATPLQIELRLPIKALTGCAVVIRSILVEAVKEMYEWDPSFHYCILPHAINIPSCPAHSVPSQRKAGRANIENTEIVAEMDATHTLFPVYIPSPISIKRQGAAFLTLPACPLLVPYASSHVIIYYLF